MGHRNVNWKRGEGGLIGATARTFLESNYVDRNESW